MQESLTSPVPATPGYTVAVRALCEFTAKQGDLDQRFTPSPTSQEGVAGHATVAARRGSHYQAELSLSGEFRHLQVRGRADGYDPQQQLLEEIKTYCGDLGRMPANHRHLHWAQVKVYGWLLCHKLGLAQIRLGLVYFDIATQKETSLTERFDAVDLQRFFETICERFLAWADQELVHRRRRDAALLALRFPHAQFRSGQRDLAEAVFKAARLGRCLLAQAPTGIGKTIATIFPLLKACPAQELDKVFYLTAKGSGRNLALRAIGLLKAGEPALPLRVVELVARDKACVHPDKACHGDWCPLAAGFYDRLPAARAAAATADSLDKDSLRDIAAAHRVCPYYLGQEMVRWSDVVVGDYNHYFDIAALLHALTLANQWRVGVLVDEAHNLLPRARTMYSAELHQAALKSLRAAAPAALKKPLDRLQRAWSTAFKDQDVPYKVHPAAPARFVCALQDTIAAMSEHLAEQPAGTDAGVLDFHFAALHFVRMLDSFASHSLFDVTLTAPAKARSKQSTLCVRNLLPAVFLKPRFAAARTVVLFSATLTPQHFHSDTLGLPDDSAWIDVATPFEARQLCVRITRHVSTRYRHRDRSLAPIASLIAEQYQQRPGNYLAFFSSYDYLDQAARVFGALHPDIPAWGQARQMNDDDRRRFLERFAEDGRGIGFAVLGGSFAEGIDLPGKRLIGAFIATLGLPQLNPVNEELRRRIDAAFGTGYEYAYLFPGIQKVVQAAGRVIRSPTDEGVIHLIDDRFARAEVRRLLPTWWAIEPPQRLTIPHAA